MRISRILVPTILVLLVCAGIAAATPYEPPSIVISSKEFDHGYFYEYGIAKIVPFSGDTLTSATLTWNQTADTTDATFIRFNVLPSYAGTIGGWNSVAAGSYPYSLATSNVINELNLPSNGIYGPYAIPDLSDLLNGNFAIGVDPWCHYVGSLEIDFHYRSGSEGTVPEPTSLLLLGTGLAGIGLAAWRRRK